MKTMLETKRLILRPWREDDAESLYEFASDPRVGPAAGWPVHTSVENSRDIIRNVLAVDGNYAVTLKGEDKAVGCAGLMVGGRNTDMDSDEAEIGYWIGAPYWGQGLIPEAVRELMRYAFGELGMAALWCGYFDGNEKSKRVQEKYGFIYHHTDYNKPWDLMGDIRTEHFTRITRGRFYNE